MAELLRRLAARPFIALELLLASLGANLLALASPLFVIQVLNRYVVHGVDETLATLTAGVVIAIVLEFAFRQTRRMLAARLTGQRDTERAIGTFGLLLTLQRPMLDKLPAGDASETVRGVDSMAAAYAPANIGAVLDVPFGLVFLGALALLDPVLGMVASGAIALALIINWIGLRLLRGPTRLLADNATRTGALLRNAEQGADTVRAFSGAEALMERWRAVVERSRELRERLSGRQDLAQSLTQTLQAGMGVAVIAVGAVRVVAGDLDVGTLIGANILAARALAPLLRAARLGETFARARQAAARIKALARLPVEPEEGVAIEPFSGKLELRDVAFAYPEASGPLFEETTLAVPAGGVLVVTGGNGTGKSTLARLVVGLLAPSRGQVLADGVELRQISPAWWRRQISYVPQEPLFLDATLRENLRIANPDLDDAKLPEIIEMAGLSRFVSERRDGLDMALPDGGMRIALGMRKRLALARALAVDGQVVVFDEPTGGLDDEGRRTIYGALRTLVQRGRTVVVMSRDPTLLKGARLILSLDSKPRPKLITVTPGQAAAAGQGGQS